MFKRKNNGWVKRRGKLLVYLRKCKRDKYQVIVVEDLNNKENTLLKDKQGYVKFYNLDIYNRSFEEISRLVKAFGYKLLREYRLKKRGVEFSPEYSKRMIAEIIAKLEPTRDMLKYKNIFEKNKLINELKKIEKDLQVMELENKIWEINTNKNAKKNERKDKIYA